MDPEATETATTDDTADSIGGETQSSSPPGKRRDSGTTADSSALKEESDTTVRADGGSGGPPDERSVDEYVAPADEYKRDRPGPRETAPREALHSHVNTQGGSTALSGTEAWVQENSREPHNDGRSPTRTYFNPNDTAETFPGGQKHRAPEDRRSWGTLAQWQDGVQSDISRGSQNWWADKQRWVDIFGDQMGATEYHMDRCKDVLENIEISEYQPDRIPAELIIIGILSLLIDDDITDPSNFGNRALKRGNTEQLLADIDASVADYQSARSKLQQRDGDLIFQTIA